MPIKALQDQAHQNWKPASEVLPILVVVLELKRHLKCSKTDIPFIIIIIGLQQMPKQALLRSMSRSTRAVKANSEEHLQAPQPTLLPQVSTTIQAQSLIFPSVRQVQGPFHKSLWKLNQNISYMRFLIQNRQLFAGSDCRRRSIRINVLMSAHVVTRSPAQCRSHHQKMMLYHRNISSIIEYISLLAQSQSSSKDLALPQCPQPDPPAPQVPKPKEEEATLFTPNTVFDWDSWMEYNEKAWEARMVEEWLDGMEGLF